MRITGGIHRSRRLSTPKNQAVRPTSDKVRQAVFNMLKSRDVLAGANVLDAFCGTGALGLEALSQGADHCVFFDKNRDSITLCKENVAALREQERSFILFQDALKLKEKPDKIEPISLVFLDPPYDRNLVAPAIEQLHEKKWLADSIFFVIEISKNEKFTSPLAKVLDEKIYGDTKIILAVSVP